MGERWYLPRFLPVRLTHSWNLSLLFPKHKTSWMRTCQRNTHIVSLIISQERPLRTAVKVWKDTMTADVWWHHIITWIVKATESMWNLSIICLQCPRLSMVSYWLWITTHTHWAHRLPHPIIHPLAYRSNNRTRRSVKKTSEMAPVRPAENFACAVLCCSLGCKVLILLLLPWLYSQLVVVPHVLCFVLCSLYPEQT